VVYALKKCCIKSVVGRWLFLSGIGTEYVIQQGKNTDISSSSCCWLWSEITEVVSICHWHFIAVLIEGRDCRISSPRMISLS
jgi:hypothetical protein